MVAEVAKVAEVAEVTTKFYFYLIVQEARSNKRTKIFKILTKMIRLSLFPPPLTSSRPTHPHVGRHHERAFVVLLGGRAVRI